MTINSTTRKAGPFNGTGLQTAYPFAFKVFTAGDMLVVQTDAAGVETVLTLNTDYTIALNADQNANPGGTVNVVVAPASGAKLTISSAVATTQGQSIPNMGGFYPKVVEDGMDRLTILVQQLLEQVGRSVKFAISDITTGNNIPAAAARANNLLGFDSSGNMVAAAPISDSATAVRLQLLGGAGAGMVGYDDTTLDIFLKSRLGRVVNSISALRTISKTKYAQVFATGYYASGDGGGGPYYYDPTDTATADNGGTVIVAADGGRWKLVDERNASLKTFGAKGDGVVDDRLVIYKAIVAMSGKRLWVDVGTFLCQSIINLPAGVNTCLEGVDQATSIIKVGASVTLSSNGFLTYSAAAGFTLRNFTIDHNNRPCTVGSEGTLTTISCDNFEISGMRMPHIIGSGISCNGPRNAKVLRNYIGKDVPAGTFNQAILIGSSARQALDVDIIGNYCDKTAINASCTRCTIAQNTVSGWGFGGGITTEQDTANSNFYTIIGNRCFEGVGTDVNNTSPIGIENWGAYSVISGNICYGNSGTGIDHGGRYGVVTGNICFNNGTVGGNGITARYGSSTYNASYSTFSGNQCFDTQSSKTQSYGFEEAAGLTNISLAGNSFNGSNKLGAELLRSASFSNQGLAIDLVANYTIPLLTAQGTVAQAFSIAGAALGDFVIVSYSQDLAGIQVTGYVSAPNTVYALFRNETADPKTIAAGQVRIKVIKMPNFAQY